MHIPANAMAEFPPFGNMEYDKLEALQVTPLYNIPAIDFQAWIKNWCMLEV